MLFRERLTVPIIWWVLAGLFSLSVLIAVGAIFGSASIVISVDEREIQVGRAAIEHLYIATCLALNAEETRRRTGVEADARAHMVLRPYIKTTVEITLDDPEDPVPYWLVSTRHPQRLAAALQDRASSTLTE